MNTEQCGRVNALIERLEDFQKAIGLSDARFCARYQRYVGSAKQWRDRICGRNWAELGDAIDKWESRLAAMVTEIDCAADLQSFNPALPIAKYARVMFEKLQGASSDRRCVWLIADYGAGKSWALKKLRQEHPAVTAYFECDPSRRSVGQVIGQFAKALRVPVENSPSATWDKVLEHLRANPVTVLIDEAHEAGTPLLKMVKGAINQTRAKFILATYPTGWNRLKSGSHEALQEARQLMGRTIGPVNESWSDGVTAKDVEIALTGYGLNGEAKALSNQILPLIRGKGNFRVLDAGVEKARELADGNTPTAEGILEGVNVVIGKVAS